MRAARIHAYGPPASIVLEDLDMPKPKAGQMLVRVSAAGVGNWDALVRTGRVGLPLYATCASDMVARAPANLPWVAAAALPVAAVTAWQMVVEHARVAAGQVVVVHGAGGSVGALAVQIARSRGANVIGTIHSDEDEAIVRMLGVTQIVKNEADFLALKQTADVVIDTVGGRSQALLFPLIRPGGMLVSSVSQPDAALAANARIRAVYFIVRVSTTVLDEISKLLQTGQLRTRIGASMPLREVRTAHEMLDGIRRRPRGKIVLDLG